MADPLMDAKHSPALFIWAPSARCGITLLQRLISSSREILVFGENFFITSQYPEVISQALDSADDMDAARERMVGGDYNFWSSEVSPDSKAYITAAHQSFYLFCHAYLTSAAEAGFKRWGIKEPKPHWPSFERITLLLPQSQHIFLYRNPIDVVKSYKSRGWLPNEETLIQLCQIWNANVQVMVGAPPDKRLHTICYEKMLEDKGAAADRLKDYLEVEVFDLSVFETKVNTFPDPSAVDRKKKEYVEPSPLTESEKRVISELTAEGCKVAGYDLHQLLAAEEG